MAASSQNALLLLEEMLDGKTTLRTQRVTHRNIICVGTDLLDQITELMELDRRRAVVEALKEANAKAQQEKQNALQTLRETLQQEKEDALEKARQKAEEKMAMIKYRCEVAEKKRMREAQEQFKREKEEALRKAEELALKEKEEAIKENTEYVTRTVRNICAVEREQALAEALANAREKFAIRLQETIERTKRECKKEATDVAAEVARQHKAQVDDLQFRLECLDKIYMREKTEKERLEHIFHDMRDDYKRFQDYTKGFHSDYLLK